MPIWRNTSLRAFTLLEILVSMTVVLLLTLLLGRMLTHASGVWSLSESNKERLQNIRAIDDLIGRELRAALLPVERPSQSGYQLIVNPAISSGFKNRDAFFWQTPMATDQTLGDVAEAGYFVQWDDSNPANPKARLCRFFVNPVAHDSSGAVAANPDYLITGNPAAWITDSVLQAAAPANEASGYQGLLAENVVGLWVRCLNAQGQPITSDAGGAPFSGDGFDSRRGYTDSQGVVKPGCALPPLIEVSLALVDSRTAARIGPEQKEALSTRANASADASEFVSRCLADPAFHNLNPGLRSHRTRIYLQTSR